MAGGQSERRRGGAAKGMLAALALLFLTGPWLLALVSHIPNLTPACGGAYRFLYAPLAALFAPMGARLEDHVLDLASPALRQAVRSSSYSDRDRSVTVVSNGLAIAFLAFLGGSVGSFLNVVVYRLPRGLGLLRPGSHCPACGHPVRARDNVPVVGWLVLGGRCRDCQAPIAVRYPLVEASVAAGFLLLGFAELFGGGGNLPDGTRLTRVSGDGLAAFTTEMLWIYLYHCCLVCVLLAAALIAQDGQRLPRRLAGFGLAVGLLGPIAIPSLRPVDRLLAPFSPGRLAAAADGLVGLSAGYLLGILCQTVRRSRRGGLAPSHACHELEGNAVLGDTVAVAPAMAGHGSTEKAESAAVARSGQASCLSSDANGTWQFAPAHTFALACVGAYLGWQALVILGVGFSVWSAVAMLITDQMSPARMLPLGPPGATLLFLLVWKPVASLLGGAGPIVTSAVTIGCVAVTLGWEAFGARQAGGALCR